MPELPEVETVRLQLTFKVLRKKIVGGKVYHQKTVQHDTRFIAKLRGRSIDAIDRIGKLLIFTFTGDTPLYALCHLKMTGQFFYVDKTGVSGGGHSMTEADVRVLPNKHTRVALNFEDGSNLYFNDMRLFGYFHHASAAEVATARAKFGQEPTHDDFNIEQFVSGLKKRRSAIKAVLLDQSFVAGLGNIYVDEALFAAKVRPMRSAATLTRKEATALAKAARAVLLASVEVGGTTFQHFKDTGGENGNYTDYLQVFGKQKTPCPRCGAIILKIRVAGRGTHYCAQCQR